VEKGFYYKTFKEVLSENKDVAISVDDIANEIRKRAGKLESEPGPTPATLRVYISELRGLGAKIISERPGKVKFISWGDDKLKKNKELINIGISDTISCAGEIEKACSDDFKEIIEELSEKF